MKNFIARFIREEEGQDLIEYALLAGFIALFLIVAVQNVGTALNTLYGNVNTRMPTGAAAS